MSSPDRGKDLLQTLYRRSITETSSHSPRPSKELSETPDVPESLSKEQFLQLIREAESDCTELCADFIFQFSSHDKNGKWQIEDSDLSLLASRISKREICRRLKRAEGEENVQALVFILLKGNEKGLWSLDLSNANQIRRRVRKEDLPKQFRKLMKNLPPPLVPSTQDHDRNDLLLSIAT